ncbi:MAG: hypothetical protein ACOCWJ_03720 [Verrucomicrobiota bacterium]
MEIEVLLQSIGLWAVVLFSLRVAAAGNPAYQLVFRSEPTFLERIDQMITGERTPENDAPEAEFLRRFSRLILLELVVVGLEFGLLIFFVLQHRMPPLAWMLLGKNILMIIVGGWGAARQREDKRLFARLQTLPRWIVVSDRVSSLISAVGFIILLLAVNNLLPE